MLSKHVAIKYNNCVCFATSFLKRDTGSVSRVSGGGLWLASMLARYKLPFIFMNAAFHNGLFPEVRTELRSLQARNVKVLAVSLYSSDLQEAMSYLNMIRRMMPDVWIVCGGPVVNAGDFNKLARLIPDADCFIKGDSEVAFLRVARVLLKAERQDVLLRRQQRAISKVRGIYFRHFDFVHQHDGTNAISNRLFNAMELCYQVQELWKDIKENGGLYLNTRRGCKYRCIFCSHKYSKKAVAWSAPRIIRELRKIKDLVEAGVLPPEAKDVFFSDDDFFQSPRRAKNFLKMLAADEELNNYFRFIFEGALPSFLKKNGEVDVEMMELLSKVRDKKVVLGTDAFNDDELKYFRKNHYGRRQIREVVAAFERYNIPNIHFVILTSDQTKVDTLMFNLFEMLHLLKSNPKCFRVKISNFALILQPGSTLGRMAERRRLKGLPVYFYLMDGQYHGLVVSRNMTVMDFLQKVTQTKYRLEDDIRRLEDTAPSLGADGLSRTLIDDVIKRLRRMIDEGGNRYHIVDYSARTDYLINVFVVHKLIHILDEILEPVVVDQNLG